MELLRLVSLVVPRRRRDALVPFKTEDLGAAFCQFALSLFDIEDEEVFYTFELDRAAKSSVITREFMGRICECINARRRRQLPDRIFVDDFSGVEAVYKNNQSLIGLNAGFHITNAGDVCFFQMRPGLVNVFIGQYPAAERKGDPLFETIGSTRWNLLQTAKEASFTKEYESGIAVKYNLRLVRETSGLGVLFLACIYPYQGNPSPFPFYSLNRRFAGADLSYLLDSWVAEPFKDRSIRISRKMRRSSVLTVLEYSLEYRDFTRCPPPRDLEPVAPEAATAPLRLLTEVFRCFLYTDSKEFGTDEVLKDGYGLLPVDNGWILVQVENDIIHVYGEKLDSLRITTGKKIVMYAHGLPGQTGLLIRAYFLMSGIGSKATLPEASLAAKIERLAVYVSRPDILDHTTRRFLLRHGVASPNPLEAFLNNELNDSVPEGDGEGDNKIDLSREETLRACRSIIQTYRVANFTKLEDLRRLHEAGEVKDLHLWIGLIGSSPNFCVARASPGSLCIYAPHNLSDDSIQLFTYNVPVDCLAAELVVLVYKIVRDEQSPLTPYIPVFGQRRPQTAFYQKIKGHLAEDFKNFHRSLGNCFHAVQVIRSYLTRENDKIRIRKPFLIEPNRSFDLKQVFFRFAEFFGIHGNKEIKYDFVSDNDGRVLFSVSTADALFLYRRQGSKKPIHDGKRTVIDCVTRAPPEALLLFAILLMGQIEIKEPVRDMDSLFTPGSVEHAPHLIAQFCALVVPGKRYAKASVSRLAKTGRDIFASYFSALLMRGVGYRRVIKSKADFLVPTGKVPPLDGTSAYLMLLALSRYWRVKVAPNFNRLEEILSSELEAPVYCLVPISDEEGMLLYLAEATQKNRLRLYAPSGLNDDVISLDASNEKARRFLSAGIFGSTQTIGEVVVSGHTIATRSVGVTLLAANELFRSGDNELSFEGDLAHADHAVEYAARFLDQTATLTDADLSNLQQSAFYPLEDEFSVLA